MFIFIIPIEILRLSLFRKWFRFRIDRKSHYACQLESSSFSFVFNMIFILEHNPCESSPCQHQSVCITKSNQNIQCICRPHYTGKFCEYPGRKNNYPNIYLSNNLLVPFRSPAFNQKCHRICQNGGICLVKKFDNSSERIEDFSLDWWIESRTMYL
jgi:hypothetical protein